MVKYNDLYCPECGGQLYKYNSVTRILRTKYRAKSYVRIKRMKCTNCGMIHRQLTPNILPYKHYEAEMIFGVLQGLITPDVIGFEDFPSEITMERWKRESADILTYFDFTNSDF